MKALLAKLINLNYVIKKPFWLICHWWALKINRPIYHEVYIFVLRHKTEWLSDKIHEYLHWKRVGD